MLQIIIFSFNRALQLDTLLSSFTEYWKNPAYQVDVIYNTSDDFFQKGYELLIDKFKGDSDIRFHKESKECRPYTAKELLGSAGNLKHYFKYPSVKHPRSNFRPLMIQLMEESNSREIMFMTDDAMYIRPVDIPDEVFDWINADPKHRQFSLRLGIGMNGHPDTVHELDNYLEWRLEDVPHMTNWGYYFSVDAHIYDKQLVLDFYKRYIFANPNSLEGYIEGQLRKRRLVNVGRSFKDAKLLSFPINMVQTVCDNESLGVSVEKLNQYYLDGYTLKYPVPEKIDIFQVYPDHLLMEKDGKVETIKIRNLK
jgi:hypothetical protein